MKKEYIKPELNISEYVVTETIASVSGQFGFTTKETDTVVFWDDFQ